ncbi:putative pre-rRNA processing protein FTSJ3 [Apostichopus japonicus]|uniref:Putative pre-rRNA processing protein FTSJ3 n=1 Tax=Stichopus japonicus TaxID=307972 RepID=A0A2G8KSB8_STIJA|nr:putative pre-rRNA processing protein FTSJ3 [Apostichopus japonicus]
MGKKAKVGKQRKDKYYHLAKETGYRSRSAFKLLQLNRKFDFLQKSRVLIDLCAAPGGWLQVASKTMPVSSVVIGVDLFPIKSIPRVSTFIGDITTEKCRKTLKKELHHWKADCVLHDGAPNVGTNWLLDAHTQVFRSRDYQSLVWVFHQLFRKVHATKPAASRHESAEIFVVCQGFIAPDKIDQKFFDPKYIFKELPVETAKQKLLILQDPSKQKKAKAEGYAEGEKMSLYRTVNMTDFLNSEDPVIVLNECSELIFDAEEIKNHRLTTDEIKECAKDIKVLGRREIRLILTWHKNVRKVLENAAKWHKEKTQPKNDEETKVNEEDEDSLDEDKLQGRLQKTTTKKKRKLRETLQKLGMMQSSTTEDEGPDRFSSLFKLQQIRNREKQRGESYTTEDEGPDRFSSLFKLQQIRNREQLSEVEKGDLSFLDKEEDATELPEPPVKYVLSRKKTLDDPTDPDDADDEEEYDSDIPSDLEEEEKACSGRRKLKRIHNPNRIPTQTDESNSAVRAQRTTSLWFSKDVFDGLEMEEDEDMEISQMSEYYQTMGGSIRGK